METFTRGVLLISICFVLCLMRSPASAASGSTVRVSVTSTGEQANGASSHPAISSDGRYVAFVSRAGNLVDGDMDERADMLIHDLQTGATKPYLVDGADKIFDNPNVRLAISGDGSTVISVGCGAQRLDVAAGLEFGSHSGVSADGRYFVNTRFAGSDPGGVQELIVEDGRTGTVEQVNVNSDGQQGDASGGCAVIAADGRSVAFMSGASNLTEGSILNAPFLYLRDLDAGTTEMISVNNDGEAAMGGSGGAFGPAISGDGRFVAFWSQGANLSPADTNTTIDVFLRDRESGTTELISINRDGRGSDCGSAEAAISADGRFVAFESCNSNLVDGDTNYESDVFVRDRAGMFLPAGGGAPEGGSDRLPSYLLALGLVMLLVGSICARRWMTAGRC